MASQGGNAGSVSSPVLPSICSVQPLRRSTSLTSRQRVSAADFWEATLRRRLGTPGPPPPREAVPGLYDAPRLPMASGASKSAPSTVGPSASVVAWFAQYQCTKCGQVPTSLEARFCHFCGASLPLPRVPGAVTGGSSRVAQNLGEVAAAAALEVIQSGHDSTGSRSKVSAKSLPDLRESKLEREVAPVKVVKLNEREANEPKTLIEETEKIETKKVRRDSKSGQQFELGSKVTKGRRHRDGGKRMQLPGRPGKNKELPWGTRESQVAHWLDNIRPRRP